MVDDPDLCIAPRRHGHRLEADGDGGAVLEAVVLDAIHLEVVVRGVDGEEQLAVRRQGERTHMAALEEGIRRRRLGRPAGREAREQDRRRGETRKDAACDRRRSHEPPPGARVFLDGFQRSMGVSVQNRR
ncbi:hypothetical protein WME91_45440 [Sorangium sp. So ce269]